LGTVVSDYIGTTYVGLLSALIVLAGASTAVPSAYLANAIGKPFVMTVGGSCMAFAGFAFYFFTDAQLGTWTMIVVYLTIYGLGRGTWVSFYSSCTFS
jgi:fucose permease